MSKPTKKELAKYEMNVLSPRSYNYAKLRFKDGEVPVEIKPYVSVKGEALFDVIFDRFVKQDNFKALENRYGDEEIWATKFDAIVKSRGEGEPPMYNCVVELDSREIRKALGLPRFTDKQIFEEAEKLAQTLIKAEGIKNWTSEERGYITTIIWIGHLIRAVKREKTERVAHRTKDVQHKFKFVLEDATVMLWSNDALFRRMSLFQTKYYSLPYGCQRLLRYLSLWNESKLNLKQVADILDWKSLKDMRKRKKQVEKILKRLNKEGYITGWNRIQNTRGLKTVWFIEGINTIRQKPKAIEVEVVKTEDIEEIAERDNVIEAELVN